MISRLMKVRPILIAVILSVSILLHLAEKRCVFKSEVP